MGLETASYIADLVSSNPVGSTDPKSQGDEHLRLIKAVLLATLPNLDAAVNATPDELNLLVGMTNLIEQADLDAVIPTGFIMPGLFVEGDLDQSIWLYLDDGTIGDASSSATSRANADTEDLFTMIWDNISDTYAPVPGGRGASAAADYAAHKQITLPALAGRALAVAGSGSGLTVRSLGQILGEEEHQLTTAEMPSHTHSYTHVTASGGPLDPGGGAQLTSATTGATGGDDPHNNMQPTVFLHAAVKI